MNKPQSHSEYYDQTFDRIDLTGENLESIEFEECEFRDCQFSESKFRQCKFINCTFIRCNLSLMKVPFARFSEVSFIECKLVGIDWSLADWPNYRADADMSFRQCIMNDNSFFGLTLKGLILKECKLHDADFREGDFSDASMTYCDFTHSVFMRTNLQNADFTESTNLFLSVLDNNLTAAKFSRYEALGLLEALGIELVD
ncbi:pentapeptide repeat-containing protein [Enterovibrio sp. ZSDZ42]|uniref:Pentapeptide repeat-containing protein n=1 Tax=Enterovibrio gelatinilyticus TaxID=2899819 RepID=A0ABT5R1A3_9GAMM|nr:pentapeptide repeat-containing protein [Enterovibrio sp. ZSDZ42]MDD1794048.1 pentapeptide repeat-containing protein [Enterovibrio sp. ZSDZ42]